MTQKGSESKFKDLLSEGTRALHTGKTARAIDLLEQAHRLDEEDGAAALNLAGAYILTKKFAKAVGILESLKEREPDNPMVWINLGAAYLGNPVLAREADQRRAIAAFEEAWRLDPKTPSVAYNLGLVHVDRKDYAQAIHWFQQALEFDPDDRDARNYLKKLTQNIN